MDPHAVLVRHRAARQLEALAAVQKAYRSAITTPNGGRPLNVTTPQALEHPRTITLSAAEVHALLRSTTPRNARKPERKAHAELAEALALALARLGEIDGAAAPPPALAAARLAARKLDRWLARHDRAEGVPASLRLSTRLIIAPKNARSHPVPPPSAGHSPLSPAAGTREWAEQQHAKTKAENSARRRHFLAVRAATRGAAAAASVATAAGAAAPAVVPLPLHPTTPKKGTRPCAPATPPTSSATTPAPPRQARRP